MDEKITVTVNDEEKTFKMSYALLNRLSQMVGEYENPSAMFVDPDMQEKIILQIIKGKKADPENDELENYDVSIDDGKRLVEWAGNHVMDFFMSGLQQAEKVGTKYEEQMQNYLPSQTGSES